jgi:hypothetical protein
MKLDRLALYPQQIAEAQMEWQNWKVIILQRNRMLDIWENKQRVRKVYPYTIDELNAMDKFSILKLAIKQDEDEEIAREWTSVDNLDETHELFIEFFQTLPESPIKRKAIAKRYEAIKEKERLSQQAWMIQPWQEEQQQGTSWPTNSAANVSVAQASAQQVWQWSRNWPDANINW